MTPRYSVSILTHVFSAHTRKSVESVLTHSSDFELLLTAQASPEAAAYFHGIAEKHPNVRVLVSELNRGFIAPNNNAAEIAVGERFVCLNDDAAVPSRWLELLEKPFKQFPTAAITGAQGTCCSLRPNMHGYEGAELEFIEGSCLMVRTDLIRAHGLFSNYLTGAYFEDSDLSLRMRELGYTIHQANLKIQHVRFATSSKVPEARSWFAQNMRTMAKRWRHYLKVRRFDYPIVLHSGDSLGNPLLTQNALTALRLSRPLSPIYIETESPDLFNGLSSVINAAKVIPPMEHELRINLDNKPTNVPTVNTRPTHTLLPGRWIEKKDTPPTVTLLYVFVPGVQNYFSMANMFVQTYLQHPPDYPHKTMIVCNGTEPDFKAKALFARLPDVQYVHHDNSGWDIGAYIKGAGLCATDMLSVFGSHCYFKQRGWLKRMVEAWQKHGPGMYGTFAAYEVRPHLNTMQFWCAPELLARYPIKVATKQERYSFEHNGECFWQMVFAEGYPVKLVLFDGEYEWQDWRKPNNIYRREKQSNCLLGCRLTLQYDRSGHSTKRLLANWADTLRIPDFEP